MADRFPRLTKKPLAFPNIFFRPAIITIFPRRNISRLRGPCKGNRPHERRAINPTRSTQSHTTRENFAFYPEYRVLPYLRLTLKSIRTNTYFLSS